jgi:hypothetical protein
MTRQHPNRSTGSYDIFNEMPISALDTNADLYVKPIKRKPNRCPSRPQILLATTQTQKLIKESCL